jgi:hypothetical protein
MKKIPSILHIGCITAITTALFSCGENTNSGENIYEINDTVDASEFTAGRIPVTLLPITTSPEFPDAKLKIKSVNTTPQGKDSTKLSIQYDVINYELKHQTADAGSKNCNNSDKGQHIHFILDNTPYAALYEPKHEVVVANNTEHYIMSFLSRSYHESLKNKDAGVLYSFKIDEKGKLIKLENPKTPMVFYSRPKGDYLGNDTTNLLLDFYVYNATLGNDYKVKTVIQNNTNNQSIEMLLDDWKPYFIQNLGTGKATVALTLLDKNNQPVTGPMTQISREITLAAKEPLQ